VPDRFGRSTDQFYEEEGRRLREAQRDGVIAPLPFDRLILAATSLLHGLAHMIINAATKVRPGDISMQCRSLAMSLRFSAPVSCRAIRNNEATEERAGWDR
jgi:hypothetical protein